LKNAPIVNIDLTPPILSGLFVCPPSSLCSFVPPCPRSYPNFSSASSSILLAHSRSRLASLIPPFSSLTHLQLQPSGETYISSFEAPPKTYIITLQFQNNVEYLPIGNQPPTLLMNTGAEAVFLDVTSPFVCWEREIWRRERRGE
jgi:hypothetical protein